MIHRLKTLPKYFKEVVKGNKTFEARKNDRNFQVGDILILEEFTATSQEYTGFTQSVEVTYLLNGGAFGIEEGYVVMAIKPI